MSTTFDSTFGHAVRPRRSGIWPFVQSLVRAYRRRSRHARDRRALHELPDYMLRDLGIDRSEIDTAVANGRPGRMPLYPY